MLVTPYAGRMSGAASTQPINEATTAKVHLTSKIVEDERS
jgi:hypothetical protein